MTTHDPGGKSRLSLLPGVRGDALFAGAHNEHRIWLSRFWEDQPARHALCIGMNPSTAEADIDDLTLRKDQGFVRGAGMGGMFKVNVGSYRCTDPSKLPRGVALNHPDNFPTIRHLAADAALILVVTGEPPEALVGHARTLFRMLRTDGRRMHCLGLTKSHWPKHSSRLAYATEMQEFVW